MKTSQKGIDLIKKWEGLRTKAYLDGGGVLTIGYGHTSAAGGLKVTPGLVITEAKAGEILKQDLSKFEARVNSLVKVPLSQNQFDTLVSFDFNTGALHSSTLLKKLNSGDYKSVPDQLMRWVHDNGERVQGLVNRRKAEVSLWNDGKAPEKTAQTIPSTPATSNQPWWLKLILSLLRAFTRGK